ncbi:MAG: hypothetical protein AAB320_10060 [Elusimicrobiota bacterium]
MREWLVFKRFSGLVLATALLVSSNGILAVVQLGAWAEMTLSRWQSQGLASALESTVDGKHPCHVCIAVSESAGSKESVSAAQAPSQVKFFQPLTPSCVPSFLLIASLEPPSVPRLTRSRRIDAPPPKRA